MMRTDSASFPLDRPVSQFVTKIRHIRMLEAYREYAIAKRWREHGDRKAQRLLIASQLRLVVKIAWSYRAYGIPFSKLICEGNIGLMEAVKRFDPDHGVCLATYSTWQIHAAILDHLLQRVRTAAAYKKLRFDLRRLETRLTAINEDRDTTKRVVFISEELDLHKAENGADSLSSNPGGCCNLAVAESSLNPPWNGFLQTETLSTISCRSERIE